VGYKGGPEEVLEIVGSLDAGHLGCYLRGRKLRYPY